MAEGGGSSQPSRETSPKAIIDTSPLHIDQNKESLKVKLMLRRPLDQLVAQGIMPPHKTPAAFHGQRRQLERAKTGDLLKAKIQQRPSRQELERRHILESDPGHLDPSLAERQRMLKKARLADQLNDQLSHRPGPLELIRKNILHTEEPIEQAVKTGQIPYKATSEGQLKRPQHPCSYITPEDDSQSSAEGDFVSTEQSDVFETATKSGGIVVSLIPSSEGTVVLTSPSTISSKDNNDLVFADLCRSVAAPLLSRAAANSPASVISSASTLSPLSSVASPVPTILSQPSTPIPPPLPPALTPRPLPSPAKSDAPGKDKNRKKSKAKSIPKARTIKFHEYKGPPSAQKNTSNNNYSGESSYDLLLQQQTLLLQFQLQLQHKYPQIILPASQETQVENNTSNSSLNNPLPSPAPSTSSESSTANRISSRLEDMKVSDLKAELKRRNLPVSGSKPQLIERLKLFNGNQIDGTPGSIPESIHSNSSIEQSQNSPCFQDTASPEETKDETEHMDIGDPVSPSPQILITPDTNFLQNQLTMNDQSSQRFSDDIVKEQQRRIEELQRELTLSQLKLQAATRSESKAQVLALQKHLQSKQQQHVTSQIQQLQALQAKQSQIDDEQQKLQQQQHVAFQNQKNLGGLVLNGVDAAVMLNQLIHGKVKLATNNNNQRTNCLPNFFNSVVSPIITNTEVKPEKLDKPPPLYEEATKQINKKNNVKSQIVDDVLEILIKNGELPPSAAQEPVTPSSAEMKTIEPMFPNQNQLIIDNGNNEETLGLDPNELLNSLENLDDMDLSQFVMELGGQQVNDNNNLCAENDTVPMDTDEWLESLLPKENRNDEEIHCVNQHISMQEPDLSGYDPLLAISQDPFDPFNLDEFRSSSDLTASLSWDKLDYAA